MSNETRPQYFWEKQSDLVGVWKDKRLRSHSKAGHLFIFSLNLLLAMLVIWYLVKPEHQPLETTGKAMAAAYSKLFIFVIPIIGLRSLKETIPQMVAAQTRLLIMFLGFGSILSLLSFLELRVATHQNWLCVLGLFVAAIYVTIWFRNKKYLFGPESMPSE